MARRVEGGGMLFLLVAFLIVGVLDMRLVLPGVTVGAAPGNGGDMGARTGRAMSGRLSPMLPPSCRRGAQSASRPWWRRGRKARLSPLPGAPNVREQDPCGG